MSATSPARARRRGAITVEFSLLSLLFFTLLCAVMEVARAMYLLNTLQEVTRRAALLAAVSDFSNPAVMDQVRQAALLRTGPGTLTMGRPVTDAHLRIDYLSLARAADGELTLTPIPSGSLPACAARAPQLHRRSERRRLHPLRARAAVCAERQRLRSGGLPDHHALVQPARHAADRDRDRPRRVAGPAGRQPAVSLAAYSSFHTYSRVCH